MTVSNGTVLADSTIIGNNAVGGQGALTLVNSTYMGSGIIVAYYSKGTLYLTGGTNIFTSATPFAVGTWTSGTGTVWMSGGLLVTTNAAVSSEVQLGYNTVTPATMTMSNGTWLAHGITLGKAIGSSGNSLTIRGGQVFSGGANQNLSVGNTANASNNVLLVTDGGLLEARSWNIAATAGAGNIISNSGAIYQFYMYSPGPYISPGAGVISINSGTISFRDVAAVDVKGNWGSASPLTNITFYGANAFRLNNSTNATTSQSYTFASNLGATNYARLELVNGNTCYRGGVPTIGTGGSILFSNTVATVSNLTLNVAGAALTMVGSTVTNIGALALGEDSVITIDSNSVMNVGGALSVPTNATFTLTGGIDRNAQVTLFNAASIGGASSSANWTVLPTTHRVRVVGNSLVIAPRGAGFIIKVQ